MSERDVLVYVTKDTGPVRYPNAWIQADDATVLIRQRCPDQPAAWETTAVYGPGTYERVTYADEQEPQPTGEQGR